MRQGATALCLALALLPWPAPAPSAAQSASRSASPSAGQPPAGGPDAAEAARTAAAQLRAAQALLDSADGARDRVLVLSQTIAAYEAGLESLREGLRRVALREAQIQAHFDSESARLSQILGALQAMSGAGATEVFLHPDGALQTARAGMILSEVTPALNAEVAALRSELVELGDLRTVQAGAAELVAGALDGALRARTELSQAISDRRDLPRRYLADPDERAALLSSADTLDAFAAGLAAADTPGAAGAAPAPPFADAKGTLPLPVLGRVLRRFGEPDAAGVARPGLVLATAPGALVTTPWSATIRYRGPLLDYGNVMILEPQSGYLVVLAGLGEVYGDEGEVLPPGAAVGLMPGSADEMQAFFAAASEGAGVSRRETLYMELRQGGTPVDPAAWFALTRE